MVHAFATAVERKAPRAVQAQLDRWNRLREGLADPSVELTVDEFAPVLSTFHALRRAGCSMDPMLTVLIGVLERQLLNSPEDSDSDFDDGMAAECGGVQ